METIVNKFKSMYKTSVAFSIILICVGVFLLINSEVTLSAISYFIGITLMVWGLVPVLSFIANKESQNYLEFSFIIGIFSFIFGIIIMVNPKMVVSIIPLMIGIWMLINGGIKLYYAVMLNKETNSIASIVISAIILVCGFALVCNPYSGAKFITKIIGAVLIIYSVLDLIECYNLKKSYKNIKKEIVENVSIIEAEATEKEEKKTKKQSKK